MTKVYYCNEEEEGTALRTYTASAVTKSGVKSAERAFYCEIQNATTIKFQPGTRKIREGKFEGCHKLGSDTFFPTITVPDTVTHIEKEAFYRCYAITQLYLSARLERIGERAFCECRSLSELRIPLSLVDIGKEAFNGCTSLTQLLPQQSSNISNKQQPSLLSIGESAFARCTSLRSLSPPLTSDTDNLLYNLQTIHMDAFGGCTSLTSLPAPHTIPHFHTIRCDAFFYCKSLTDVTLGPSVVMVARNAFQECVSLAALRCVYRTGAILPWAVTHVTMLEGTTKVSNSAFVGCAKLKCVEGLTTMYGSESLSSSSSVLTHIGDSAFWGCKSLPANIDFGSIVEVGVGAFAKCMIVLMMLGTTELRILRSS